MAATKNNKSKELFVSNSPIAQRYVYTLILLSFVPIMKKIIDIKVQPKHVNDDSYILERLKKKVQLKKNDSFHHRLVKKSIDARGRLPIFLMRFEIFINESLPEEKNFLSSLKPVTKGKRVIVVGAGPAGYFAALKLLELGLVPIILDRGKDVRARRRDLRAIQQFGNVNPHSN